MLTCLSMSENRTPKQVQSAVSKLLDRYLAGMQEARVILGLIALGLSAEDAIATINERQLRLGDRQSGGGHALLRLARLRRTIVRHADGYNTVASMSQNGLLLGGWNGEPTTVGLKALQAQFDRTVAIDPIASAAVSTLGSPERLNDDSDDVMAWLVKTGAVHNKSDILDLGCGIGRVAERLSPICRFVQGIDLSRGMVEEARQRCVNLDNVAIRQTSGANLAPFKNGSFSLVISCHVFPYFAQLGMAFVESMLAEILRVLCPGGYLAIVGLSFRGDDADRRDIAALATATGFQVVDGGKQASALGGCRFLLQRPPTHPPGKSSNLMPQKKRTVYGY